MNPEKLTNQIPEMSPELLEAIEARKAESEIQEEIYETTSVEDETYDVGKIEQYAEMLPVHEVEIEKMKEAVGAGHKYWVDRKGEMFGPAELLQDWASALKNPEWADHITTILLSNKDNPIWVWKETGLVFNGMHRFTKAVLDGDETIKARIFESLPNEAKLTFADEARLYIQERLEEGVSQQRREQLTEELHSVTALFEQSGVPYFIAGGTGLDLLDGKWDRDHQDLDIAIFSSDKKEFIEYAVSQGFKFTDADRKEIQPDSLIAENFHNAFAYGEGEDEKHREFEVIFLEDEGDDVVLANRAKVGKEILLKGPRVSMGGKEVSLQSTKVIMFYKLMDGRRKDLKDLLPLWNNMKQEQRDTVESLVADNGGHFQVGAQSVSSVQELFEVAEQADDKKKEAFFSDRIDEFKSSAMEEVNERVETLYEMSEEVSKKQEYFEKLAEKYGGWMPERRKIIEQIADFLYQSPKPDMEAFRKFAHSIVDVKERVKEKALYEYLSEKIWEVG